MEIIMVIYMKVLCLIACWVEDPNSEAYKLHLPRIPDYFWLAEDGLKLQVSIDLFPIKKLWSVTSIFL